MANAKFIQMKAEQVTEIAEKIKKAESVIVFDYRGLTVSEVTELRANMRKAGVEYSVLKNGIVARAAKEAGIADNFHDFLKGPSAFAFGYDDAVAPAKLLKEAIKKYKKCEMKGGIVNGEVNDAAAVDILADLPSREQLLSRLLGCFMSPLSKLASVLDQIAKKQSEAAAAGAEAPAEAPAAAEAPVETPAE